MRTRPGRFRRYGFAVLIIPILVLVDTIPAVRDGPGTPVLVAYLAIMLAAWYGGLGPGLLTTALITLIAWRPSFPLWRTVRLLLFSGGGVFISLMIEALHSARRRAERGEEAQRASVAELERSREALRQAKEVAEHANRAKDRFLAVLSHELRTPLTPVLATVSYIEGLPDLPEVLRDEVASIRRNVGLEARLIDDLLDVTRLSRGDVGLDRRAIDAHEALRAAFEICRAEAEGKGVPVSLALGAGEHHVQADSVRLQQVAWNLINNAVKFTPAGGRVTVRTTNPAGGRIAIEVSDTGVGIEPEFLPRVFDAFGQEERTVTPGRGGLGLGLTIARRLVELHGGTLTASSRGLGEGSTFVVEL
jgi:signal transduction histidine kinase